MESEAKEKINIIKKLPVLKYISHGKIEFPEGSKKYVKIYVDNNTLTIVLSRFIARNELVFWDNIGNEVEVFIPELNIILVTSVNLQE